MKPMIISAVCVALLAPAILAGNVLVVDASGGGSFTTIQSAVNAAVDGDTILVKTGSYAGFTINNKSVAVVADTGAAVDVTDTVRIENLGFYRDALLVGLQILDSTYASPRSGLWAETNQGSVRVENCVLESIAYQGEGATARDCSDVAFARCSLFSGHSIYPGEALLVPYGVFGSRVAVYDSLLQGGDSAGATDSGDCTRPDGGTGADVRGPGPSFLFAAGSILHGGEGGRGSMGDGLGCQCPDGGVGGDGVRLDFTSTAALFDNTYHAGQGGPCGSGTCCFPGYPGQDVHGTNVTFFSGGARRLAIENPRREQVSFPVRVTGSPGEAVYLFISNRTGFRYVPGYRGVQLTQQPGPPIFLGRIPQSGILSVPFSIPDLGPGVQSRIYYFQAAHLDPLGVWTLGTPVSLVVLDQAF